MSSAERAVHPTDLAEHRSPLTPEQQAKAQELVDRYPISRSALLPLLHLMQHVEGYVSDAGIAECARLLGLTKAEIGAVATFYTMFKRHPMGRHLVSVCTNFSCKVRGAGEVYERLSERLGVGHNQTTADGEITLEHAECLGNCEGAPVVTVDYYNYECVGPDQAVELVERLIAGEVPPPTRGLAPSGIRDIQHRLAGLGPLHPDAPGVKPGQTDAAVAAPPTDEVGPGYGSEVTIAEFEADKGEGDLGAEETGPGGLGVDSGTGGGHEYPPDASDQVESSEGQDTDG